MSKIIVERFDAPSGIVVRYPARITGEEVISVLDDIMKSDDYATLKYFVGDRTMVEEMLVSLEETQQIAELNRYARGINLDYLVALVSPTDLIYGLSRQVSGSIGEEEHTLVCRTLEEAESWLSEKLGVKAVLK